MASIKFSAIIADARGKIGGSVFVKNANGSYIRTYTAPLNKNTPGQQLQRANMTVYSQKWRALTDDQRNSWGFYAPQVPYTNRVGDKSIYTGFQLFMKTNMILEAAALDQ
jgi:hypothetical protein